MRIARTWWKRLAIGLAVVVILGVAAWTWLVPVLLVRGLEARTGSKVEIRGWWINARSSGVTGVRLHEDFDVHSPVWASAAKASTDLTLGDLLRGRTTPARIRLTSPEIVLRVSEQGDLVTPIRWRASDERATPVVIAEGARVTLRQEGRPAMVVTNVTARLGPVDQKLVLSARSNDPSWGPAEAHGQFAGDFSTGSVVLKTMHGIEIDPAKARQVPFVIPAVWAHVTPKGTADFTVAAELGGSPNQRIHVQTDIDFRGTRVTSDTLDLTAEETTGRVNVDQGLVTFKNVSGRAIDGRVTANGTLDFRRSPVLGTIQLDLDKIDVASAPRSWQLHDVGITGRLSGKVQLLARMRQRSVDFSGTTGDAVVEKGMIQGIPFKLLRLSMRARGKNLEYESGSTSSSSSETVPIRNALGTMVVALQPAISAGDAPEPPRIKLPESLTTHIELEDVHLDRLLTRVEALLGYPFPIPITGRLSLKAEAHIPLGKLASLRDYAFHGDLTLTRSSIYKVDLGHVSARIDLERSVLVLKDVRGRLVNQPNGGPDNPPKDTGEIPRKGPLPPGGFRGDLRAELSAIGRLSTRFEGERLPLGEMAAPAFPRPTPLSGEVSLVLDGFAPFRFAREPAAWKASMKVDSRAIQYRSAKLDGISAKLVLDDGKFAIPELSATLRDKPLKLRGSVDLKAPRAFRGSVDVTDWDLSDLLAWWPSARRLPVDGLLTGQARAEGTLAPSTLKTEGKGTVAKLSVKAEAVGDMPFDWTTRGETVLVNVPKANVLGGTVSARATLPPRRSGEPMTASATLTSVDLAPLVALIPGDTLNLSGKASGKVEIKAPAHAATVDATVDLTAPDLTVQGIAASGVNAAITADESAVRYEVTADSLGGKVKFKGAYPLGDAAKHSLVPKDLDGELHAVGFTLDQVWKAFGQTGAVSALGGRGALNANLRAELRGTTPAIAARGFVEFRDLLWKPSTPLGGLSGVLAISPERWRLDSLRGEVLGGAISGHVQGDLGSTIFDDAAHRPLDFSVRIDRVALKEVLARAPALASVVEGFGSLRIAGGMGEGFQANGDFEVAAARFARVGVSDVRIPIEVSSNDGDPAGVAHLRRWSARLAGGQVRGDAWFRLGTDRAFSSTVEVSGIDIEPFARIESQAIRPATGRVTGKITLLGADLDQPRTYRGRVVLDLDDASLVAIPVFREIDRFLGAARGGLFEDGDLEGSIANQQFHVDMLTLQGRLIQLHASGTVGFDGVVNLEVVVNTNQIIPQTGEALVSAIPGLRNMLGRNAQARLHVANYLSNRLLKLRVTGTLRNPSVALDPGIALGQTALSFFVGVLKLPLGLVK